MSVHRRDLRGDAGHIDSTCSRIEVSVMDSAIACDKPACPVAVRCAFLRLPVLASA
jgi:hypothetical protein